MALNQSWMLIVGLLIAIIISVAIFVFLNKKKPAKSSETQVANLSRLTELPEYQASQRKYRTLLGFSGGILGLLVIFSMILSAQPVSLTTTTQTKYNRDIVMCLDVSASMVNVDLELLDKFKDLTEEFQGERISLVIWNSKSFMVFPLTDDYDYIRENLEDVYNGLEKFNETVLGPDEGTDVEGLDIFNYTVDDSANGSLIGDGLTACSLAFNSEDSQEPRSKSIILATDNVVNGEQIISLDEAVQNTTDKNITIYGIKPTTDYEVGGEAEEMQALIEGVNNGKYYELTDPTVVPDIVNKISQEEVSAIESDPMLVKTPTPQIWIGLIGIGILSWLILAGRLKV